MKDPIVYRSTHPDVLAHWDAKGSREAQQAWRARVDATVADLGFEGRNPVVSETIFGATVTGVQHPADQPIPDGWRRHPHLDDAIAPHKATKTGKAAAAQLRQLDLPNPRLGMPGGVPKVASAAHESAFLAPAVQRIGDAVYLRWSQEIAAGDARLIDGAVWERVPLSEYYAAREAAEQDGADQ
ncbi:hypothetical protein [Actinomadura luteofluorescens]|uniref:hypothetical protein n=1 Tax=Actinomadura luteofluorescens TaxID=46163 RepID=UPI003D94C5F2